MDIVWDGNCPGIIVRDGNCPGWILFGMGIVLMVGNVRDEKSLGWEMSGYESFHICPCIQMDTNHRNTKYSGIIHRRLKDENYTYKMKNKINKKFWKNQKMHAGGNTKHTFLLTRFIIFLNIQFWQHVSFKPQNQLFCGLPSQSA